MADDSHYPTDPAQPLPIHHGEGGNGYALVPTPRADIEFERDGLDLATIVQILWTRGYWILAAAALGLAVALILSLFQTPLYRSTAVLELNPPTVPVLPGRGQDEGNLVVPNTDHEFLATQYGLLKSRTLAERVVQDLNLAKAGASEADGSTPEERTRVLTDRLARNVEIKPVRASRLVELSYTTENPARAARIVNGFTSAFLSSTLDRRFDATASAREFLKKRLETVRSKLDESERNLVAYAKANNIINTSNDSADTSEASSLPGASLVALNAAWRKRSKNGLPRNSATANPARSRKSVRERPRSGRKKRGWKPSIRKNPPLFVTITLTWSACAHG